MNTADYEVIDEETQKKLGEDDKKRALTERATHVVRKGVDHPSFFAKGCEDIYF